jgi:hypothetical protein
VASLDDCVNSARRSRNSGRRGIYCDRSSSIAFRGRPPGFIAGCPGNSVPSGLRALASLHPPGPLCIEEGIPGSPGQIVTYRTRHPGRGPISQPGEVRSSRCRWRPWLSATVEPVAPRSA